MCCSTQAFSCKLLFNVVEPFLKKHYDNMERKDVLQEAYDMDKFPKYKYD